jgi:UDP-N-acetylmuramoyl-L-alanyl-D-glutamate--2,6-diaminopimelate ligase
MSHDRPKEHTSSGFGLEVLVGRIKRLIPRPARNAYHFMKALIAIGLYGYPAKHLRVIGVTGTDGKTTTCQIIYSIFRSAGIPASLISTTGAIISADEAQPIGLHVTTPGPFLLQRLLRDAKNTGSEYVVLETTSHGLDQYRVLGCNFEIGVVTNVTHEHLDYHRTFEEYLQTKARLLRSVKYSILNLDDASFGSLVERASGKVLTYGVNSEADVTAVGLEIRPSGMTFHIPTIGETINTQLIGTYNVQNVLAAASVGVALEIDHHFIADGLSKAVAPRGRLERIDADQDFSVFVDFAHTPNSLANVLTVLKQVARGKLIVVFGCAGERDKQKRKPMGEIATQLGDYVVITAEDPRTENLDDIISEIALGCESAGGVRDRTFFCIEDRQNAINYAIQKLAKAGDVVVVTGKAHEKSMCFGTVEYPWDEFDAVQKALSAAGS